MVDELVQLSVVSRGHRVGRLVQMQQADSGDGDPVRDGASSLSQLGSRTHESGRASSPFLPSQPSGRRVHEARASERLGGKQRRAVRTMT